MGTVVDQVFPRVGGIEADMEDMELMVLDGEVIGLRLRDHFNLETLIEVDGLARLAIREENPWTIRSDEELQAVLDDVGGDCLGLFRARLLILGLEPNQSNGR